MKRLVVLIFILALLLTGCKEEIVIGELTAPISTPTPTIAPTPDPTAIPVATPEYDPLTEQEKFQLVLEGSLEGIPGEFNGWGYKEHYGYYIVNQDHIKEPGPGYQFLTLWIELEDGTLSPVEEHVRNGRKIYPVNEGFDFRGTTFIPFYYDEVSAPNRGMPHENGVYWLDLKYLDYYPTN